MQGVDGATGAVAGTLSGPLDFSTNSAPVFSIASTTVFVDLQVLTRRLSIQYLF